MIDHGNTAWQFQPKNESGILLVGCVDNGSSPRLLQFFATSYWKSILEGCRYTRANVKKLYLVLPRPFISMQPEFWKHSWSRANEISETGQRFAAKAYAHCTEGCK